MTVAKTIAVLLLFVIPAFGQQHSSHGLGKVDFQNSCNPAAQGIFQSAVAMLHSFRYTESEQAFREVLAKDPSCGIAAWGIAANLMSNPLAGVGSSAQAAVRAQAAIEQGRKIGAGTQRERDYIEAVAAYYDDSPNRPERIRQMNRSRAFEALAARYPDDDEAQIFSAVYLAATQSLADKSYAAYLRAAGSLEKQFVKHPEHPGVAHYLIHSYDASAIAAKGLTAARRYAGIAPAAPHALHMPSHIFTRIGSWDESAATNERSAAAAKQDKAFDDQLHAMDYLVYAYLQLGRDADARRVMEEGPAVVGFDSKFVAGPYALAAMPARYAVERGEWKRAAALDPLPSQFAFAKALTHFARALGAARTKNAASADKDVEELARLRDVLRNAKNDYWASEVEVNRLAAAAWTAFARGRRDEALGLMRTAADLEDKNEKHIVTPGRILPAREMLGELLLALKRPAEALKEFEASHIREPERFRGLYGAAQAAEKSGDKAKAKLYYTRLIELAGKGVERQELVHARAFRAKNP